MLQRKVDALAGCGLKRGMDKGIIYYTDNSLGTKYRHIFLLVQSYIKESGLPNVSCSLRPLDFGNNIVLR